eukprot:TRINITY_DN1242_c0_g1_i2.p1 TRINITY_DN1242_c0_g1~~TRINITY_DN1242_c0_g1_i2.p1  ORF type:complete len:375 (-),score=101.38 TRINITY_DN1242_c0_g1_i2:356-1456(-)
MPVAALASATAQSMARFSPSLSSSAAEGLRFRELVSFCRSRQQHLFVDFPSNVSTSSDSIQCLVCPVPSLNWTAQNVSSRTRNRSWPLSSRPRDAAGTHICFAAAATNLLLGEEVEFVWSGFAKEVLFTADFLNWETKIPLSRLPNGGFSIKQKLSPGQYAYKFIVDGVWQHNPDFPTVEDGTGGFNNSLTVTGELGGITSAAPAAPQKENLAKAAAADGPSSAPVAAGPPVAKAAAAAAAGGKKVAGKAAGKKVEVKSMKASMEEDIIPQLSAALSKEEGLSALELSFGDNQLRGQFVKGGTPHTFWAYFPDGKLDGAKGFSLAAHGAVPSTVEPFLIDERKVTPELLVFWVVKRLYAQKLLSLN